MLHYLSCCLLALANANLQFMQSFVLRVYPVLHRSLVSPFGLHLFLQRGQSLQHRGHIHLLCRSLMRSAAVVTLQRLWLISETPLLST
jgi:hypothetical protein